MADSGNDSIYVAAIVAYNGGAYNGFQLQPNVPTVQEELERALVRSVGRSVGGSVGEENDADHNRIRVTGSGRTDTGVHARGQVIAAHVPWRHALHRLMSAWNAHLPDDIVVNRLVTAPESFHPRFSASRRTYRYYVTSVRPDAPNPVGSDEEIISKIDSSDGGRPKRPRRSPLTDHTAFHEPRMLDLDRMNEGAARLVGEHDFATFGRPPQGVNTVRTVFEAEWQEMQTMLPRLSSETDRTLVFTVTANGFLQHMVRNLVGSLLAVGLGQRSPDDLFGDLVARDRKRSAPPAPPQGLILEQVDYPAGSDPFHFQA